MFDEMPDTAGVSGDIGGELSKLLPSDVRENPGLFLVVSAALLAYKHRDKLVGLVGRFRGGKGNSAAAAAEAARRAAAAVGRGS